jgi:hypothetical protein
MKIFDTQFVAGGSLELIAHDQTAADKFNAFLEKLASNGWSIEHIFQVSDGLLVVISH